MAIIRNSGAGKGVTFIDVKGKPQIGKDAEGKDFHGSMVVSHQDKATNEKTKEVLPSNTAITGLVTSLNVKNSIYQGKTINSLVIRLEDGVEAPAQLNVALGSFFSAKVVGMLNGADLSKPIKFAVNTVKEGDKMGDGVAARDNAFPTIRDEATNDRAVAIYAGGVTELPEAADVVVNGTTYKDMANVNVLVAATIQELYEKLAAIREVDTNAGHHDEDEGLSPDSVQAAAREAQRG